MKGYKLMKKRILLAVSMLSLCSGLVSCNSDDSSSSIKESSSVGEVETLTDSQAKSKIVEAFFDYTFSKQGYGISVSNSGIVKSDVLSSASTFDVSSYTSIFSRDNSGITIKVGGSTSVEKISQAHINSFKALFSSSNGVAPTFTEDRKGSGTAVSGVNDGTYDIGYLSREISEDELLVVKNMGDHKGAFCIDAVVAIVNASNGLVNASANELARIYANPESYAGKEPFVVDGNTLDPITNWSSLSASGLTTDITVYSRDASSGTRECFTEKIGIKDAKKDANMVSGYTVASSNGNMITSIENDKNGIGYASYDSVKDNTKVKMLSFNGIAPSISTIEDSTYALQRNFNIVAKW